MYIANSLPPPCVAVIFADTAPAADDVMASFALSLRDRGWWVRGILSTTMWQPNGSTLPAFVDLDTCNAYAPGEFQADCPAQESRDKQSQIITHMKEIVCEGADLAIFPRFTAAEAAGKGVAAELYLLMASGIPLLTSVRQEQFEAWKAFTRNHFVLLPPSLEQMFSWVERVWQERHEAATVGAQVINYPNMQIQ